MRLRFVDASAAAGSRIKPAGFATATVLIAGICFAGGYTAGHSGSAREAKAAPARSNAEEACGRALAGASEIERRVKAAASEHGDDLKRMSKAQEGERLTLNVSVSVDGRGRLLVEDAWVSPGERLGAREIIKATGIDFSGLRAAPPPEGTRCSFVVPVPLENKRS
ncbi:MAG: hypothetical protein AB1529_06645 [Candidatus Micrarchaeota archaeon]